jgi:hypothetical protein
LAIRVRLAGEPFEVRGVIAIAARPPAGWGELPRAVQRAKGCLVSEQDFVRKELELMHASLLEEGVRWNLQVIGGLGHYYPPDLPERLPSALEAMVT